MAITPAESQDANPRRWRNSLQNNVARDIGENIRDEEDLHCNGEIGPCQLQVFQNAQDRDIS